MTESVQRTRKNEARYRLRSVDGLTENCARAHLAIDQNATACATVIEAVLSKTTDAIQHQSEVTEHLGRRLEQAPESSPVKIPIVGLLVWREP